MVVVDDGVSKWEPSCDFWLDLCEVDCAFRLFLVVEQYLHKQRVDLSEANHNKWSSNSAGDRNLIDPKPMYSTR